MTSSFYFCYPKPCVELLPTPCPSCSHPAPLFHRLTDKDDSQIPTSGPEPSTELQPPLYSCLLDISSQVSTRQLRSTLSRAMVSILPSSLTLALTTQNVFKLLTIPVTSGRPATQARYHLLPLSLHPSLTPVDHRCQIALEPVLFPPSPSFLLCGNYRHFINCGELCLLTVPLSTRCRASAQTDAGDVCQAQVWSCRRGYS